MPPFTARLPAGMGGGGAVEEVRASWRC